MIKIEENYKEYIPHPKIKKSIKRMISNVPQKRLLGIHVIILTNTKALNNKKRRQKTKSRKRKVALNKCLGWYIQKWDKNPAYIELLIDNIFENIPKWFYYSDFLVDIVLSSTVYHEIGHHIHYTQAPEFNEREDVAEKWKKKLSKKYFTRKYWYIVYPIKPIIYVIDKWKKKN